MSGGRLSAVIGAAALITKNDARAVLFPAAPCGPLADVRMERRLVAGLIADRLIAAASGRYTPSVPLRP